MRCAAGGATTTCSPTCSAPACSRNSPAGFRELHRNAAAWYEEHGLADDAIRHAVAAGEMTWAARLIEQHFDELFYLRGEGATVQRWLSALPDDLVRSRPRLLLAQALMASYERPHGDGGAAARRGRAGVSRARPRSRSSLPPAGPAACW